MSFCSSKLLQSGLESKISRLKILWRKRDRPAILSIMSLNARCREPFPVIVTFGLEELDPCPARRAFNTSWIEYAPLACRSLMMSRRTVRRSRKSCPSSSAVLADLAGHPDPDKDVEPLKDRIFTEINRDSFGKVMEGIQPRLSLRVANELQRDESKIALEINFNSIDDFEPENIISTTSTPSATRRLDRFENCSKSAASCPT